MNQIPLAYVVGTGSQFYDGASYQIHHGAGQTGHIQFGQFVHQNQPVFLQNLSVVSTIVERHCIYFC